MTFSHPDYTIIKELGRGGSAQVYLAVQKSLNRHVAVKVLHSLALLQTSAAPRFMREARTVAKLRHPCIVPVFELGQYGNNTGYYMTMEYLRCGGLLQQRTQFTLADLLRSLQQVTSALAFSHSKGVVHRDVKPDNILFRSPEEALLADFGIARLTDSHTHMTMTGTLMGSANYMSPEQVLGEKVGPASDLYSLGIVMHEMLTGRLPFSGDSAISTGLKHINTAPPPMPEALGALQPTVDWLLQKQPSARPESATELGQVIDELVANDLLPLHTLLCELPHSAAHKPRTVPVATSTSPLPMAQRNTHVDSAAPTEGADKPASFTDWRRSFRIPAGVAVLVAISALAVWQYRSNSSPDSAVLTDEIFAVDMGGTRVESNDIEPMGTPETEGTTGKPAGFEAERETEQQTRQATQMEDERKAQIETDQAERIEAERIAELEAQQAAQKMEAERIAGLKAQQAAQKEAERIAELEAQEFRAAEQAAREAEALASFERSVDELSDRINEWLFDSQPQTDAGYEQMAADLDTLLAENPEHRALLRLKSNVARRLEQLSIERAALASPENDTEDVDRFNIPGF